MTWMQWYNSLVKPSWTPAPSTISLIWTILYPVILVSFGFVFVQAFRGKVSRKVALPFAINVVGNLLFMPIFAGLRSVPLACVDILEVGVQALEEEIIKAKANLNPLTEIGEILRTG